MFVLLLPTIRTDTAVHLCVESAQSDASLCLSSLWIFELRSEAAVKRVILGYSVIVKTV